MAMCDGAAEMQSVPELALDKSVVTRSINEPEGRSAPPARRGDLCSNFFMLFFRHPRLLLHRRRPWHHRHRSLLQKRPRSR